MTKDIRRIVKEGYEKGDYEGYFRTCLQPNDIEKKFLELLVGLIPNSGKILDFGCGIGIPCDKYLADKGFSIIGVDIAEKHIKAARMNVPNATFIQGDFSTMNFNNEKFDAIIATYSVFHIPRHEQPALFQKMNDLLEPGGFALMSLGTEEDEGYEENWCGAPMAWSNYDPPKYKTIIEKAGFVIVESDYEGQHGDPEYHWWVIIKKNY